MKSSKYNVIKHNIIIVVIILRVAGNDEIRYGITIDYKLTILQFLIRSNAHASVN